MEVNPHAAPQSRLDGVVPDGPDPKVRKAVRGERLGATIVIAD
jgi:hypothetical protein